MKKNYLKIVSSIIICGAFLFIAFGSGGSDAEKIIVDINDPKAIETYMQGKWHFEDYAVSPNETTKYRFEIVGNTLKIWSCIGNVKDPFNMNLEGDPKIHEFTLGQPTRDVDGYHARYLEFDEGNVSLTYRALSPIWFLSDAEYWDEPQISSVGGNYWGKGW